MYLRRITVILVWSVLAGAALAQPTARYRTGADGVLLPDPQATPGATLSVAVPHLCTPGYAGTVRHVPATLKQQVYSLYGVKPKPGVCCEVDHLISLELGGSNDLTNLWPQPYTPRPGAHEKDVLENFLHRAVCTGAIALRDAQQKIATDWYRAFQDARDAPVTSFPPHQSRMTLYTDLEQFVTAHRPHGELTWQTTPPTPEGYRLELLCPCGVTFERWVLPQDAAEDLLRSGLSAFEN